MRTIAIINQKGGCGKTTVAVNLAAVLAARGCRTVLVDMDPQSHCALGLAVPESQIDRSICDVLRAGLDGSTTFSDIVWQISRNLDLAPSTMALAGVEAELTSAPDKDRRLLQVLSNIDDDYEFCVIDCPPAIGILTFNALRAAQEVLVPVETGYFSMHGAIKQEATIQMLARRANHHARLSILATMYDVRTKLAREILAELRRGFGDKLLPITVHFNSKLKEAASFGQAITEYDPASRGYQDFDKLVTWLLSNPPTPPQTEEVLDQGREPPVLSRAAELVERARSLSARTAALADKIASDPDVKREPGLVPAEASDNDRSDDSDDAPGFEGQSGCVKRPLAQKLARVHGVRATLQGLLFVLPDLPATKICIAGDFNRWDPQATPMSRDERLGIWEACIQVPPGRYRYRLVVDGKWIQDPHNNCVESNPFGELNNVVEVGAEAARSRKAQPVGSGR